MQKYEQRTRSQMSEVMRKNKGLNFRSQILVLSSQIWVTLLESLPPTRQSLSLPLPGYVTRLCCWRTPAEW